ncbi:putative signal peptide protein [Puccinia sorghi]|uniref:Putative signal peptide protein n=1 Tax=Puccinia sorghi TaxID=27349 RepID=A0A0L6VD38_9BASI|nr:putative signal peptide protein [Puccinia sorghi]
MRPTNAILLAVILLLGGLIRELYPDSSTAVGEKVELYAETAYGSEDLTHWVNGYRHIPHFYPKSGEHKYHVAISAYLQEVTPQIETQLYKEAEQSEVDSLSVSNTRTPILIRPNESSSEGNTCPYTSNMARPNGMLKPISSGIG